jgi:polyisoprenoid-binding protein YceI
MRFARFVFITAGIWGISVLMPLYWLVDITGRQYSVPDDYPHFFYGFIFVAIAWQIAFLIIGSNPARFRLLMIPGILEKLGYVAILAVLYGQQRIPWADAQAAVPDGALGMLFVLAFIKTRPDRPLVKHDERQEMVSPLRKTILGLTALIVWLASGGISSAQPLMWTATTGEVRVTCPLTIGGSFEARTTALTGRVSARTGSTSLDGEISVDLKTLDTGIGLRNRHMLDNYLEVQKGGDFDTAAMSQIDIGAFDSGITDGTRPFTARLRLHGTTQAVAGTAKLITHGSSVRVEASFPLRISDYGIAEPRHLGVGVRNEIAVHVVFLATRVAPTVTRKN